MKKFISGFLFGALLFSIIPVGAAVNEYIQAKSVNIKAYVNGQEVQFDAPILSYSNRTYPPIRQVFEALCKDLGVEGKIYRDENSNLRIETITKEVDNVDTPNAVKQTTDPVTGLPVGAKWVDFEGCKAIEYNGKIFLSETDLARIFEILYDSSRDYRYITYKHGDAKIEVDVYIRENFINSGKGIYINKDLFAEFLGE